MACSIIRHQKSKEILDVKNSKGNSSKLFKDIHSNVFLASPELSVKIYLTSFSEGISKTFEGADKYVDKDGEPILHYKTVDGKVYDNLEESIIHSQSGQTQMGFVNPKTDEFIPVVNFDTANSERSRFMVDQISEGTMSAERYLDPETGETRFQGKGEFPETRLGMARATKFNAALDLGIGNVKVFRDGTFTMEFNDGLTIAESSFGADSVINIQEVPTIINDDPTIQNRVDIINEYIDRFKNPRNLDRDSKPLEPIDEDALKNNLFNFLKGLGFSTTSLENYVKNYNTKYGKDPDVLALTDIANKVVAFANGDIRIEDLSEEVAHIAIEAYSDQNSIVTAVANIHLTAEYKEFSEYYRQKYAPFYEGFELEEQVRKEILGKILAKQLLTNFQQQQYRTQEELTVIESIKELWNKFANYISNLVRPSHTRVISQINDKIAKSVLAGDKSNFKNSIESNKNFFYSAMASNTQKIEDTLKITKYALEDLFSKTMEGSTRRFTDLNNISDAMEENSIVSSVNTIVGIAQSQLTELEAGLAEAHSKGELLSKVDSNRHYILTQNVIPHILKLRSQMSKLDFKDPAYKTLSQNISEAIDDILRRKGVVDPDIENDIEKHAEKMLNEAMDVSTLTEEEKQQERDKLAGNITDTTFFGKFFSLVTHSRNPLIAALGSKVVSMQSAVNRIFKKLVDKDVSEIYEKGLDKYQRNIIKSGTNFYQSMINWDKYWSDVKEQEMLALLKALGKTEADRPTIEKMLKKSSIAEIINDEKKYKIFKEEITKWKKEEGVEQRFNKKYYEDKAELYKTLNVSKATEEYLSNQNSVQYTIDRKYRNPDGTIDRSKYTAAEKIQIINARKAKADTRSIYDNYGNKRVGLRKVRFEDYQGVTPFEKLRGKFKGEVVVLEDGFTIDDLPEDSRISFDLNNLAMKYAEKDMLKGKPLKSFAKTVKEVEQRGEDAFEWIMSNASINMSDNYFDNLGDFKNFSDIAKEYIDTIEDDYQKEVKQLLLETYEELQRRRKDLLRKNRKGNNSMETDVANMVGLQKEAIVSLDEQIEDVRRNLAIPTEFFENSGSESASSKGVNEDFEKLLKESRMSAFDFVMKHLTRNFSIEAYQSRNVIKLNDFAKQITDLIHGRGYMVKDAYEQFFQETLSKVDPQTGEPLINGTMSNEEVIQVLKNEYAKKNAPSYFQRYSPQGYEEFIRDVKEGKVQLSDIIDPESPAREELFQKYPVLNSIEFTPDYSWTEDLNNEEYINDNYYEGGYYLKPRLDKYIDSEFFNRYGISEAKFKEKGSLDLNDYTATQNVEEYELLKKAIGWREQVLEHYGDTEQVNKFQRPQLTSSNFEKAARFKNVLNKGEIKDFFKDIVANRIDEKMLGEQLDGANLMASDVKIIPKYFQQRVEDPSSLTENVLSAGLLDLQQAIKYTERKRIERDMQALQISISKQNFANNNGAAGRMKIGKKGEVSHYHEKAVEYVNHHLYGVRQTRNYIVNINGREVDASRVVNKIQGATRFSNLAYNAFVDLTSATTGVINNAIDRVAGDFYHKSSSQRALTQWTTMMGSYLAEAGKVNKSSKLNQLLEFFGIEEIDSRIGNSSFNRGLRMLEKSPYLLSKLCNMPVTPKTLLSILNDMRYSDGEFRTWNQFYANQKIQDKNLTKTEIEAKWNQIKEDSLYDNLSITPNGINFNDKFLSKYEGDLTLATEKFNRVHERATAMAKQVIEGVDGVVNEVDQVAAQRDTLMNLMMMHKGWLLLNLTRRFKKTHYNQATGQVEEGHYTTLFNFFKEAAIGLKDKQRFKDYYQNLSPYESRNLKRSLVETGLMGVLLLMGELVLAGDDEDDTYIEDLAQLIYMRTVSEYNSAQLPGIEKSIIETAKSPFVAINTIEALGPFTALQRVINEDADGNNKLVKAVTKVSPLRRLPQYQDIQGTLNSFRHFNDPTLFNLGDKKKAE
jgi:hypothetical protein